ncbi:tetratricopeptide repeat protein [Hymenobacter sp. B1770]|uniref:tetratricopeptide repeat protein n=1 Tax=Hymenobacter sp. B1770 TaxID=1718788 RepID=UPI003CF3AB58
MLKPLLTIFLTISSLGCLAQAPSDTTGIQLFNQGRAYYEKGQIDSTLAIWSRIVDRKIGLHYDIYGDALFNIPNLYSEIKDYAKAKAGYRKVLASNLRDDAETGSLMEPHTNYKHKAAIALAGLYQKEGNYNEVLSWLNKAESEYPYWGFEGSDTNISQKEAYLLAWKTDVLLKLNRKEEAVQQIILELIYADELEEFFSESEDALLKLVDKKRFAAELNNAVNKLVVSNNDDEWKAVFTLLGLTYNVPISKNYPPKNLPHYYKKLFIAQSQQPTAEFMKDYIRRRSFYVRLKN